jgi:hypothetical protein
MQQLRVSWLHDRENSIMGIGFRQQPTANENPQRGGPSMSHYEAPFYSLSLSLLFLAHIVQCVVVCVRSLKQRMVRSPQTPADQPAPFHSPPTLMLLHTTRQTNLRQTPIRSTVPIAKSWKKEKKRGLANNEEKFIFVVAGRCSINTNLQKKKKKSANRSLWK